MKTLEQQIQQMGFISNKIRMNDFKDLSIFEIRHWLESHGFDRHFPIKCTSTEVAIYTPNGILMQVRASDNNLLGMWGGVVEPDETPIKGAVRELLEETGLQIEENKLEFIETNKHKHVYSNGDIVLFKSYRYILRFTQTPHILIDYESNGFYMLSSVKDIHRVLDHQREFIRNLIK